MTELPLGYRLNNPGDLRDEGIAWQGLNGSQDGFCQFASPVMGIRALLTDLHTKWSKDSLTTVRAIVYKFAPPADNNPTEIYVHHVVERMGNISADSTLDFDANGHEQLLSMARAMIRQELSGGTDAPPPMPADWYSDDVYQQALQAFDPSAVNSDATDTGASDTTSA